MLSQLFKSPERVQELRGGLGGPLLEGFAHQLCQAGYAKTTTQKHIWVAEHFISWADREGLATSALNESSINSFEHHLHGCQCPRAISRTYPVSRQNGARLFLKYLQHAGIATGADKSTTAEPALLIAFREWMRQLRGTSNKTLNNYNPAIRDLLKRVEDDPGKLDPQNVRKFVLERSQKSGWGATRLTAVGIRLFLRFLNAEGLARPGLDASIPPLAHWTLSSLPRYLQPADVERIIESCDRTTPVGCRDRAIVLLLARMGFRAGDIVGLRLHDIDWEQAWICVSGKGRRQTRLPLTQEVGDAIAAYLLHARPPCVSDKLFVRAVAPFRELASSLAVTMIVVRAMGRAKVSCPNRGAAHLLRHYSEFRTITE